MTDAPTDGDADRLTRIGQFSLAQPGTSRARAVPVPWIDCPTCAWRHYPSTSGGRWHIATRCVSCGMVLEGDDQTLPDTPSGANERSG